MPHPIVSRPLQARFLDIPQAPLVYWLRVRLLDAMSELPLLQSIAEPLRGLNTNDDPRFLRFRWETANRINSRWLGYSKGGGFSRWRGLEFFCVDWEYDGARIKATGGAIIPSESKYGECCLTYTDVARGTMGVRLLPVGEVFGDKGPAIFPCKPLELLGLAAVLNTHCVTAILRALSPSLQFRTGYVRRLPIPPSVDWIALSLNGRYCEQVKCYLASTKLDEPVFQPELAAASQRVAMLVAAALLHTVEGCSQQTVFAAYGLDADDISAILSETGTPAGWFPLVAGYDVLPPLPDNLPPPPPELAEFLARHARLQPGAAGMTALKARLRASFEAGPGGAPEDEADAAGDSDAENDDEEDDSASAGGRIPIPAETFLEELSQKLEIHPISVYWLLKEGMEQEGWRCRPDEERLARDRVTVLVLRLLGHRWPRQIEAGEPVPHWADADGIIPLVDCLGEQRLYDRLVERSGDRPLELGEEWLATEFFKHHAGQFKRRPIAWQVQSGRFTARAKPAFACLVYYHRLDRDVLAKVRNHYVGPLRQRWETELRGIESVAPAARSDRQQARRTELGDGIKELHDFDACLRRVQESGFDTGSLRDFAVQDSLLCMKARWLRRLSETIQAGPLAGWKAAAADAGLHPGLPDWLDAAFLRLDQFCGRLGPKSWTAAADPAPASLASLICEDPAELVSGAVEHANRQWRGRLDEEVLAPLRREMSAKKEERKTIQAELKRLPSGSGAAREQLRTRDYQLKCEIEAWKGRLDRIAAAADRLRAAIAAWECPEAAAWEAWLAGEPMYDAISSVDGGRRPPATVAEWVAQERSYVPDINDGVRVNIAPLQKAGLLAAEVLAKKDLDKAIADRAQWRAAERRWCREGKLPQPGWWDGRME